MSTKLIKVLVADDSLTARANLVLIINAEPGLSVVGEAENGRQAARMTAALRPDVVLMDMFMPEMDGLEATREIMYAVPTPIIVVSGSAGEHEADLALKAISSGALTALRKPS